MDFCFHGLNHELPGSRSRFNNYPPPLKTTAEYLTPRDLVAIKFAKKLAISLKNPGMRKFLKKEVIKQFDGDFNFLFGTHQDKPVTFSMPDGRKLEITFKEAIFGKILDGARRNSSNFLDSLTSLYPLLQIAIPELQNASALTWDEENEVPLVAVMPEKMDDAETVIAYDSDGNIHELSVTNEPDSAVIVISGNERLVGVPKNGGARTAICPAELEPYYSTNNADYYLAEPYYEAMNRCVITGNNGGGNNSGTNCDGCDRDCKNTKDELVKMKFKDIGTLKSSESWLAGKLEVEVVIIVGNKNPGDFYTLIKTAYGKRSDFRKCPFLKKCETIWRNMNAEILTWDKDELGDKMKYHWYEVDDSSIESVKLSATVKIGDASVTGAVTIGLKKKRTNLGDSYVEYCDKANSPGYQYNTGSVLFYVKQR